MPQYIASTLSALAARDLTAADASYSLSAHFCSLLPTIEHRYSERELVACVNEIVEAVAQDILSSDRGASLLSELKDRLVAGEPFAQIVEMSAVSGDFSYG